MLVCNVSLRPPRVGIAADILEAIEATDATASGQVVFATLVDDPANVREIVDAYLGEIMVEAASATDNFTATIPAVYSADVAETVTASSAETAAVTSAAKPLDGIASLTGAWSLSRDLKTSFVGGTRYTKTGTAITSLADQSGNSHPWIPGVSPTEATAFPTNVLCADFDGVDDFMTFAAGPNMATFITSTSGAVVVSVIIDAVTLNSGNSYNNHGIFAEAGQFAGLHARNLSGVTFYSYNWDGNEDVASGTGTVGTPYVLMWRHHAGNIYFSLNGGTEVSTASGITTSLLNQVYLGRAKNSTFCNCKIAELFTTSDGSQTTALAAAIADMKTHIGA